MTRKADNYNTLEKYTNKNKENKGPYKVVNEKRPREETNYVDADKSQTTPQTQQQLQPNQPPQQTQGQTQGQTQHPQEKTRVSQIGEGQLHNLLTRSEYYLKGGVPIKFILVCFAEWCKPCHLLAPKMDDISLNPKYGGLVFLKYDVDKIPPELQNILQLQAVPMIFGFWGNKQVGLVAGASVSELESLCDKMAMLQ